MSGVSSHNRMIKSADHFVERIKDSRAYAMHRLNLAMPNSGAALRGAHLASQLQAICQQPSIFDILSQESLMSSLKPAIGHLIKYLSVVHPERFTTANKWYDELYAIFDLLLQNHYLKRYGASFSENFYSIKRIALSTGSVPSQGIPRMKSLLILVSFCHQTVISEHA
ncbi:Putative peroxisome assembly protein 12 [Toxocara canis]|uniref:Putative peroxisome assembly protein 12 n=1 Tax=Toxocara canis TaxID=6265 RepID=A0A0B2VR49_TOXCA|nr:Putative peroxisome assembly protein 12 [Toxocara canis]